MNMDGMEECQAEASSDLKKNHSGMSQFCKGKHKQVSGVLTVDPVEQSKVNSIFLGEDGKGMVWRPKG